MSSGLMLNRGRYASAEKLEAALLRVPGFAINCLDLRTLIREIDFFEEASRGVGEVQWFPVHQIFGRLITSIPRPEVFMQAKQADHEYLSVYDTLLLFVEHGSTLNRLPVGTILHGFMRPTARKEQPGLSFVLNICCSEIPSREIVTTYTQNDYPMSAFDLLMTGVPI